MATLPSFILLSYLFLTPALLAANIEKSTPTEVPKAENKMAANPGMESSAVTTSTDDPMADEDAAMVELLVVMTECNETFRIEMEYIMSLQESGSFPDETDKTPKCYVRCVLEKIGVASTDSTFDAAKASVFFGGSRGGKQMTDVKELAAACAVRNETCKCERSYNFMKCLMESEIMKYESHNNN